MQPSVLVLASLACAGYAIADSEGKAMSKAFMPARTLPQPSASSVSSVSLSRLEGALENLEAENNAIKAEIDRFRYQIDDEKPTYGHPKLGFGILGFGLAGVFLYSIFDRFVLSGQSGHAPAVNTDVMHGAELQPSPSRTHAPVMETMEDLKKIAIMSNPARAPLTGGDELGWFDPLNLCNTEYWGESLEANYGWWRHSEIKHGRVAMAGFIGYIVHENGWRWPFPLSFEMLDYKDFEGLSAPEVWYKCPLATRMQIILFIGFFELYSELRWALDKDGQKHYMRGGKPGHFPSFKHLGPLGLNPAPIDLWDPFGYAGKLTPEQKESRLIAELNNGRLAMIGLMAFVSEARIPGSVPALAGKIKPFNGQIMAPWGPGDDLVFGLGGPFNPSMTIERMLDWGSPLPYISWQWARSLFPVAD